ncbi:MAG: carboxypeptidase-like regulatory domain-containing protein [Planctomycetota bacterium]
MVIDHNKNPISGATVTIYTLNPRTTFMSCSTDQLGRFAIDSLAPNSKYELIARKVEFGAVVLPIQQFGELAEPIVLQKGGRLVFEFTGAIPASSSFEKIRIGLRQASSLNISTNPWKMHEKRLADSTIILDTEGPGTFTTLVDIPGRSLVNSGTYTLSSGSIVKIPVELGVGVRVSGKIITKKTGATLEGVEIHLLTARHANGDVGERSGRTAISRADGSFDLESVSSGKVDIWCMKQGFTGKHVTLDIQGSSDIDAGIIRLAAPSSVRGKVNVSGSLPLGSRVFLDTPFGSRVSIQIQPDQTFEFNELTRGQWFIGLLVPGTGDCSTEAFFVDEDEDKTINLTYGPASLTGIVRGGNRQASEKFKVSLYEPKQRMRLATQTLNADGSFTFAGMPDQTVQIVVDRRGTASNPLLFTKLIGLKPGMTTIEIDLPSTEIRIDVEDKNQNPLQNIEVFVAKRGIANYRGVYAGATNEKGSMTVTGLDEGEYIISFRGTGYETASRWSVNVGNEKTATVRAQLRKESIVSVSIIDIFGNPVSEARARFTRHDDPSTTTGRWLLAPSNGTILRDGLESFTHNCLILAPDSFPFQTQITPPPEKATNLSVTLFPRGNLKIHFLDSTGAPVQSRNIDITFNEKRLSGTYDSWITNGWVTFLNEASPGQSTQIELGGVPANVDLIISGGGGIATVRVEPGKTAETILVVE